MNASPVPASEAAWQLVEVRCTAVLVSLTLRQGVNAQTVMPHMLAEVRDTVQLYLGGHITQWWAQCDAPGVVFLFAATTIDEVRALMAELPLVKEDLAELSFTRVGPLAPLRVLLQQATP